MAAVRPAQPVPTMTTFSTGEDMKGKGVERAARVPVARVDPYRLGHLLDEVYPIRIHNGIGEKPGLVWRRETAERKFHMIEDLDALLVHFGQMQVATLSRLPVITEAWRRGQPVTLHGWIYDLRDGLIRDLGVSLDGPASAG